VNEPWIYESSINVGSPLFVWSSWYFMSFRIELVNAFA
jgi:hypothetical protein